MKLLFFLLSICSFICSCQNDSKPSTEEVNVLSPPPTQVAQKWIEAFYKNDLEIASALGTDLTKSMIDSVKKELQVNVPPIPFEISEMECKVNKDSAFCTFKYQDEEDISYEYVRLVKRNNQWLVDDPWDNSSEPEIEMNQNE